jgi:diaminopimelate decarboxylase
VHCHIGSQIFETEGFQLAIGRLFQFIEQLTKQYNCNTSVVNTGGGFGIKYVDGDEPQPIRNYINAIVEKIIEESEARSLSVPEIWVEPGRGIVGEAGTTLYSVGALKKIPDIRHYLSVDGGMADNIRPALYQAKYDAVLANRMNDACIEKFTVAGKCCESGDILIDQIELPSPKIGDTLAVFSTGAYGYSMASHYNRLPKPAVVFVENGEAQLVAKRESYEDLLKNEFLLNRCAFTAV